MSVNCWWPNGDCRKQFKIKSYPIIILYPFGLSGLEYTGVKKSDFIIKFLHTVLNPVKRVNKISDVRKLQARHEVRTYPQPKAERNIFCVSFKVKI